MDWVQVATVDELDVGQMKSVLVGIKRIALYHVEDGFYATSEVCTHSGQSLVEGSLNGEVVTCPAHGGKFNVKTGRAKAFPCIIPLKKYPVEVRNDALWIGMK